MGRFETRWLTAEKELAAIADLSRRPSSWHRHRENGDHPANVGYNGGTSMFRSHAPSLLGILLGALLAAPTAACAGEQVLEFKFVTMPIDVKVVQAPNIEGRTLSAGTLRGAAFFKDGRVAVKDFIGESDLLKGEGSFKGYSTYTFEDGSSITASYTAERGSAGLHGVYAILSGTGAYAGATGTGSFDGLPAKFTPNAFLFNGKFDVKTP
jgi:hypothetical protein